VLAARPFAVAVNVSVAVAGVAEGAAVMTSGSATPGLIDTGDGEMVTPAGSPDTAIVAAVVPAGAASNREAC
jgi:hypothetical protein